MKLKKDEEPFGLGWLNRELDRVEKRRGEYITSRFYIVEITPSKRYRCGDGHGGTEVDWTKEKVHRVSEFFNLKSQAEFFLNRYEPDEGKKLEIREDKLYRRVVEEWF